MIHIVECEQGSTEWFAARLGIPTASEFKTLLGVKKDAREKLTRQTYMRKLAGEILTGEPMENYSNAIMARGTELEDEARNAYALMFDANPVRVGFIHNDGRTAGASPDSLIEDNGGLEIKVVLPHTQVERLERGELPPEYRAQVQGNIWISQREWWDFVSYCPKLPLFRIRVPRDDGYIATLAGAVNEFNVELAQMVDRIRRYYGTAEAA